MKAQILNITKGEHLKALHGPCFYGGFAQLDANHRLKQIMSEKCFNKIPKHNAT